jgi:3-hydroxybutyryl-CoA dehydratase
MSKTQHKDSPFNTANMMAGGGVIHLSRGKPSRREVGDTASNTVTISEQMVKIYAALMGDENPIHVDPVTGRQSIFGQNIAHGMLVGSLFGPVIVNQLIGPGAIYRKQSLEFDAPVPVGEPVTAVVTVKDVISKPDKDVYVLETECFLNNGKRVITGEAVIITLAEGLQKPASSDNAGS